MAVDDVMRSLQIAAGYAGLGDVDEATAWYEHARSLDPDHPATLLAIITSRYHEVPPPSLEHLDAIPGRRELVGEDLAMWHVARAKVLDRAGSHDRAWVDYEAANAVIARTRPHDDRVDAEHFRAVRHVMDADWFRAERRWGPDATDQPIFVLGYPGSGTTLVEQILASHSLVRGGGEQLVITRAAADLTTLAASGASYVSILDDIPDAELGRVASAAADAYRQQAGSAPRVTDKLPSNYHHVGLIHLLFPTAAIIHVRRDPVDTCVTNYLRLYTRGHAHTSRPDTLAASWARYDRLMDHWRDVLPAPMLEVDYERLVVDLEPVVGRILDHCGLEFEPGCLAFHQTRRAVATASRDSVRQPVYTTSVGRSRRFGDNLQPLVQALAAQGVSVSAAPQPVDSA